MIYYNDRIDGKEIVLSDQKLKWGNSTDKWGRPRDWCPIENIKNFRFHVEDKQERLEPYCRQLRLTKERKEKLLKEIEEIKSSFFFKYFGSKEFEDKVRLLELENKEINKINDIIKTEEKSEFKDPYYILEISLYNENYFADSPIGNYALKVLSKNKNKCFELIDALQNLGVGGTLPTLKILETERQRR